LPPDVDVYERGLTFGTLDCHHVEVCLVSMPMGDGMKAIRGRQQLSSQGAAACAEVEGVVLVVVAAGVMRRD
jgi:hypothetical protein